MREYIQTTNIPLENCNPYNIYLPFSLKIILKTKKGCKIMYNIFNYKYIVPKSQENGKVFSKLENDLYYPYKVLQ